MSKSFPKWERFQARTSALGPSILFPRISEISSKKSRPRANPASFAHSPLPCSTRCAAKGRATCNGLLSLQVLSRRKRMRLCYYLVSIVLQCNKSNQATLLRQASILFSARSTDSRAPYPFCGSYVRTAAVAVKPASKILWAELHRSAQAHSRVGLAGGGAVRSRRADLNQQRDQSLNQAD